MFDRLVRRWDRNLCTMSKQVKVNRSLLGDGLRLAARRGDAWAPGGEQVMA